MATARQVVSLGRAARTESKLRVRQPLRRALVAAAGGRDAPPTTSWPRLPTSST